jgi:hypothetical protein
MNQEKEPQLPQIDIYKYLCGSWKRNLEWREFGGLFQHIRTSNTVVVVCNFLCYKMHLFCANIKRLKNLIVLKVN